MEFWGALALTIGAGLATAIGGAIGVAGRPTSTRIMSLGLGFSAGVMIYVSFMELLPSGRAQLVVELGETGATWAMIGAFFAGIALIAAIDALVPSAVNPHEPGTVSEHHRRHALMRTGLLTAAALAIHNFPEGFATLIAALQEPSIAIGVAIAIAIHNIPEGLAVAVPVYQATGSRAKGFGWAAASGLAEPAGALVGFLLLQPLMSPGLLGTVFAGVAGIMVFISLDELLPTAEAYGKHHWAIYGLIAGMAVMAVSLALLL